MLRASAGGRLLASYAVADAQGVWHEVIAEHDVDGRESASVAVLPRSGTVLRRAGGGIVEAFAEGYNHSTINTSSVGRPTFAIAPDGGRRDRQRLLARGASGPALQPRG